MVVVVKGERLVRVIVPVADETEMPVPETKERTPMFEMVGVPVAEVMAMPPPAARDCTPMFAMMMELVVVDKEMALPEIRAIVEVDTPPKVFMMP